MANATAANVWIVDTTGDITTALRIKSIKLLCSSGSATLTLKDGVGGTIVYEAVAASTAANYDHDLCLVLPRGTTATISGTGAKAYLFLSDR